MTTRDAAVAAPVASLRNVTHRYRANVALDDITLDLPAGCLVGLIGPDGVGKSSLLALVAGASAVQSGTVSVLGGDMRSARHRRRACPRIAFLPQGLGRNLYPSLSVRENVEFFARLFGQDASVRAARIVDLLAATGLEPFAARPAGKLSGGMKQKLGLCCALIHSPDLLILDEPTTGVDPLSRRQFWDLVRGLRAHTPTLSVLVATAYMDEASGFDWLVAMHDGRVLTSGTPDELVARGKARSLEDAFVALLPAARSEPGWETLPPRAAGHDDEIAIEARDLTLRFGNFTAVDGVSFSIRRGEIFGFLGSNGCGKTTTMKILTGLLPASAGQAWLFGQPVNAADPAARRRVGYMTQSFSLYSELSVRQNLVLHGRIFQLDEARIAARVAALAARFDLEAVLDELPDALPLGLRQRLSLAVALVHEPEILILDEPTSGVDPVARDRFWRLLAELARAERVTIFISTHFMGEAERCDRVSLMHAGRVLTSDTPANIVRAHHATTLEEAFVELLLEAGGGVAQRTVVVPRVEAPPRSRLALKLQRLASYAWREGLELRRDPIRQALAVLGSAILMLVLSYGMSLDVEHLAFAVLDRDQSVLSRDYADNLAGSRYFEVHRPIADDADLEQRMRNGELALAIEIPPDFARLVARGSPPAIGAWIDGAMPTRAETARGYVQGMHAQWLARQWHERGGTAPAEAFRIETRFRYNPEVRSLPAMVPAVMPLLLMLIPAILTALSVVREKELGSIVNLYVTPVTRLEFLLGKQLPYVALGMANFALLTALSVYLFDVPLTGSLATLTLATLFYVLSSTALGLLISSFMRSQTAALFGTAILTLLPAVQFSGLMDPVTSLEGLGALVGRVYPTTHMLTIARGTFDKALGLADLHVPLLWLALSGPALIALAVAALRKQAR